MVAYWEIATHSTYGMFSKYKYFSVSLVLTHLSFWSGNFFLIAPFSYHSLHLLFIPVVLLITKDNISYSAHTGYRTTPVCVSLASAPSKDKKSSRENIRILYILINTLDNKSCRRTA